MQVRLGWSGEIESNLWRKTDVELDETDVYRLLVEAEVFAAGSDESQDIMDKLPTKIAFQLLQAEAEILLMRKLVTLGYPQDKASLTIGRLTAENTHVLNALKNAYGVPV